MNRITAVTNFTRPVAKWVTLERVNEKLTRKIALPSFSLLSNWIKGGFSFRYIEAPSIVQKKGIQVCIRSDSLT